MTRRAVLVAALLAACTLVPVGDARADGPCTGDAGNDGGEWAAYGGDPHGTNHQRAEDGISPDTVEGLELAWSTDNTGYQSIPVVAGRCVYLTSNGFVRAYDVATGALVWQAKEKLRGTQYQPFAVTVVENRVHVNYDDDLHPRATAFDADTGERLWTSEEITFGYPAWQLSSGVVHDGVHLIHTTGPDFDAEARPGYALLDAATGATLHKQTTIPPAELDAGYAGGGVWGTPNVDPETGYAFVGTGNPKSKVREHAYDDAIIKIDLDRSRPTFGQVVDSYKGQPDAVAPGTYDTPVCTTTGPAMPTFAIQCGQQDIDFGNGPTMWRNADGELMLAAIQKVGMFHVVHADTMEKAWTRQLGTHNWLGATGGNYTLTATDGERLYVASNPGVLWALDAETGDVEWQVPVAFPIQGNNVVLANGVLFSMDLAGVRAWDAETGARLWEHLGPPAGQFCNGTGGGISVAHHTVFASCSGVILAFRLLGSA